MASAEVLITTTKMNHARKVKHARVRIRPEPIPALLPEEVLTEEEIRTQIAAYEQRFEMSSAEFLRHKQNGTAPDTFETMYWMGLLRHLARVA